MADRSYFAENRTSGLYRIPPWQYGHATYTDIKTGRPVEAYEAQWLLDELERLHKLEALWRSVAFEMKGARDAAQEALNVLQDPNNPGET